MKERPDFDQEKEWQRWKGFFSIWTAPEPEVGQTPRIAVWKKNKATLWHYPSPNKKYAVPLFLVYSLVNKAFVLDMAPGASMIESYLQNGYDVYLLDFGSPGYEDKDITIDDYLMDYIDRAVRKALKHSKAAGLTMAGFCLGGTLAAMYASVSEQPIRNLIICVAPLTLSEPPIFDKWAEAVKKGDFSMDPVLDALGFIPGRFMKYGLRLASSPIYISPYLSLLNKAYDKDYVDRWRRFNKWTNEQVGFSGAALKQLANDIGKENKFMEGTLVIRGKKADPANIQANLLVVAGEHDRLVPETLSQDFINKVSSPDKTYRLVSGGHTTLTVKGDGLPPFLADWLPSRSDEL
ncbi:alpha/beta fold hydrolase [Domibacillus sp. A3M-37]|uniref:alpha/beta fold hydrolase n=1 Tax=Domibacillus sp. A3M-37 TaxID=2962037 RepID=UPI0020B695B8|nr:alpha/beta fold hydrolase [Domibacillus sp. A3M-37]MCP3764709.1 alpha/beta fold hydrolase [Domibacillus sp. A3M-37]